MIILYHKNCYDGFCAAWVLHKRHPDAKFIPVQYGDDVPSDVIGQDVIIADFSFKRSVLEWMKSVTKTLIVLDHHKTAQEELKGLNYCWFDMNKSGARLAWELAFPDEVSPWLVDYTEDRDLWRWQLPYSREVNAALQSYPMTFESWNKMGSMNHTKYIMEGQAINRYHQQQVDAAVANSFDVVLDGHDVKCVNCASKHLISDVAGTLAEDRPFGMAFFIMPDQVVFSLRSRDGGVDVSEICKQRGGGGHAAAAGFKSTLHFLGELLCSQGSCSP